MRGRRPRGAQRSRVASSASSTARLAASPIACTARSRPASAQRPARSRSSPALRSDSPRPASANGSSIEAVREPSVPSANALTGPIRSHSSPRPLRRPSATISSSRSAGSDAQTRSDSRRSAFSRCQAARPCSRWKSWMPVTPRACAARSPCATAASSSCSPGGGMAAAASQAAVSRSTPVGSPDASRSTTGASAIGRRASAAEDSQAVWWSCAQSSTGRSPQAASSASRCGSGSPPGQRAERQPAPISQPSAPPAAPAAAASTSAWERVPERSSRSSESAHSRKCT